MIGVHMGSDTSHTTDTTARELILNDLAQLAYETNHARMRVYPREINQVLTLTAPAFVNTYSAWTVLIPINIITMDYSIAGMTIEDWGGEDAFMIQLARSSTPSVSDYIGEMRISTATADDWASSFPIIVATGKIPINTGVWGRIKAATAGGFAVTMSLCIKKWCKMARDLDPETAWPW